MSGEVQQLTRRIAASLRPDQLLTEPEQLRTYECDGLTAHRVVPALVVLVESTEDVRLVVRQAHELGVAFVARGAGTGLSGGAVPVAEGIVISLARMKSVLDVDVAAQRVTVEPGVTNLEITDAVIGHDLYYAPDPSSQQVCTIGGNVAENAGGAHCLKHGFTVNHVTGLKVVLPDGELVEIGGKSPDPEGPDLLGLFVGSEGTLGIATEITVRVLPRPEVITTLLASFASTDAAGAAVSGIVAGGVLPSAIEMMDRLTLAAVELSVGAGYPSAGALLLVDLDGPAVQVEDDLAAVEAICRAEGAEELRIARSESERALFWKGRKGAFAAMGRISPSYYVQDGVVPRTKLPAVLRRIRELEAEHGLRVGNVFHAGDGNLHPLVLYDGHTPGEAERAERLAAAILEACVDAGGSLTGEHGVGLDKACAMPLVFSERDLATMARVRAAFDPQGIANPGKAFPTPRLCGEVPGPYRVHPLELAGHAERL